MPALFELFVAMPAGAVTDQDQGQQHHREHFGFRQLRGGGTGQCAAWVCPQSARDVNPAIGAVLAAASSSSTMAARAVPLRLAINARQRAAFFTMIPLPVDADPTFLA
jgi:hypothetical protein